MRKFILILFIPVAITAQIVIENGIPRDTSFTTQSAFEKVIKDFPFAKKINRDFSKEVECNKDLVYSTIGKRELRIDIFQPKKINDTPNPALLIIHGGGWRAGNKSMEWPIAQAIAAKGFLTATVEYRLSPEALYPAGIIDVKNAIKWLKLNAEKFNIDKNKIAVTGFSAGGELAAFMGTTSAIKKFEDDQFENISSSVRAVIDVDGILDFTHPAESNKDSNPQKPSAGKAWFGALYKHNPAVWMEASPMNYVDEKTPPFLFINSSNERYHAGRDYMIEKMNLFRIYSEVKTIPDTPHTFWLFEPWFDTTVNYMTDFLYEIFQMQTGKP